MNQPFQKGSDPFFEALVVWVALVIPEPLLDPWEVTFPKVDQHELKAFAEPAGIEVWKIDANELLNPFD